MRIDNVVSDAIQSIRQILLALDNRITAGDNLQPEGSAGQVLMSNGSNTPPSYQNIDDEVRRILTEEGLIS